MATYFDLDQQGYNEIHGAPGSLQPGLPPGRSPAFAKGKRKGLAAYAPERRFAPDDTAKARRAGYGLPEKGTAPAYSTMPLDDH